MNQYRYFVRFGHPGQINEQRYYEDWYHAENRANARKMVDNFVSYMENTTPYRCTEIKLVDAIEV